MVHPGSSEIIWNHPGSPGKSLEVSRRSLEDLLEVSGKASGVQGAPRSYRSSQVAVGHLLFKNRGRSTKVDILLDFLVNELYFSAN